MAIFDFLSGLISPVTDLVGKFVTKDEDKLAMKAKLLEVQSAFMDKVLEYETKIQSMQSDIIIAESKSDSWLTRSWRPITMLTFVALIVWSYTAKAIGVPSPELPPDLWMVIKLGLGGYVVGRSAEKIVPTVLESMKKKEED